MLDALCNEVRPHLTKFISFVAALIMLDVFLWWWIIAGVESARALTFHFLNVGQGDSELVVFPGGNTMLIDGGPANGNILNALMPLLPPTRRSIDIVALTHAQADHLSGLVDVVRHYRVGAFVWTGRAGSGAAYDALMQALSANRVPIITLREGDAIRGGTGVAHILSPNVSLVTSKDLNDTSLVMKVVFASTTALFTGDIAKAAERAIVKSYPAHVDILKVPHHGSRTALIDDFVRVLRPVIAVIEVGKNSYGHPTAEALASLENIGARVFRTDNNGTITMRVAEDGIVHVVRR